MCGHGWAWLGPAVVAPGAAYRVVMELVLPDPAKLLAFWTEWERGETPPGRVMSNLKTGGMKELLESLTSLPADPA